MWAIDHLLGIMTSIPGKRVGDVWYSFSSLGDYDIDILGNSFKNSIQNRYYTADSNNRRNSVFSILFVLVGIILSIITASQFHFGQ